ncbi:MAG: VCBS repeat-containing protein, partial [Planctomycetales bacterium]|nr:VCBS repeat-containing protein [Planctomycetales bacterium]
MTEITHVSPITDDWDTETFNEAASSRLKDLAKSLRHTDTGPPDSRVLDAFSSKTFTATPLRPSDSELDVAFSDSLLVVRRAKDPTSSQRQVTSATLSGLLGELQRHFGTDADLDYHFKIVRVDPTDTYVTTTIYVELAVAYNNRASRVQQTSLWRCTWTADLAKPLLESIAVEQFEEVETAGPLFTDHTADILGDNESYRSQLIYGLDHWRETVDWRFGMEIGGPHGLAIADVNNDGLDDLFYCETGGLPNRLYIQRADGSAEDRSADSGLNLLEPTQSALFIDLDNDGDQDAVLTVGRFVLWFANDGAAHFTQQGLVQTGSMFRSLAAADFDNDRDLDIYVCGYFPREAIGDGIGLGRPMPYHDANNGVPNLLLANDGRGNLTDVTAQVGLDANNRRFSYAASW